MRGERPIHVGRWADSRVVSSSVRCYGLARVWRALLNEALAGKVYRPIRFPVSSERVGAFARAVGHTGEGVPPTFATAPEIEAMRQVIDDPELELDFTRVVHADQSYEWRRPIAVGDVLVATPSIASIRSKAGSELLVIETEIVDDAGAPVVSARCTLVVRPGGAPA
jgi:hypothetical protein